MKRARLATAVAVAAICALGPRSAQAQEGPIICTPGSEAAPDRFAVNCNATEVITVPEAPDTGDSGTDELVPDSYLGLPSSTGIRLPSDFCAPPPGSSADFVPEVSVVNTRTINTLDSALQLGLDPTGTYRLETYNCALSPTRNTRITVTVVITGPSDIQTWINTTIARVSAQIPQPEIGVNPVDYGIVNLQTWYAVTNTWSPINDNDQLGYLDLTLVAAPTQTVFTSNDTNDPFGNVDNTPVTCTDAGDIYEPGDNPNDIQDCGHTFTYPSAWDDQDGFTITADTTWNVSWSIAGTLLGGTVSIPRQSTHIYEVREIQTIGGSSSSNNN